MDAVADFSGSLNGWLEKRVSPACDNVHIGGNGAGIHFLFLPRGNAEEGPEETHERKRQTHSCHRENASIYLKPMS